VNKLWAIFWVSIFIVGCGGFRSTRNIVPLPNEDMTILKQSNGVAMTKNGISIAVAPIQDVKELDAFGVLIVNDTPNWISVKQEECMIVQDGKAVYPMETATALARLGSGYKQKMPNTFIADVFDWRKDINNKSSKGSKVVDEDKKVSIVTGSKSTIYLYFSTQGSNAPMQLIVPNVYNETTKERTSFSFKFEIQKKK
jgi:hypothetical protein